MKSTASKIRGRIRAAYLTLGVMFVALVMSAPAQAATPAGVATKIQPSCPKRGTFAGVEAFLNDLWGYAQIGALILGVIGIISLGIAIAVPRIRAWAIGVALGALGFLLLGGVAVSVIVSVSGCTL